MPLLILIMFIILKPILSNPIIIVAVSLSITPPHTGARTHLKHLNVFDDQIIGITIGNYPVDAQY